MQTIETDYKIEFPVDDKKPLKDWIPVSKIIFPVWYTAAHPQTKSNQGIYKIISDNMVLHISPENITVHTMEECGSIEVRKLKDVVIRSQIHGTLDLVVSEKE